jgi:hypothetical protein
MFVKCVSDVNICRYNEKVGKLVFFPTKKPLSGYLRLSFLSVDGGVMSVSELKVEN